ncbi:MAG: hypothetical protein ACOX4D_07610 [Bacteroidales bacterium]|jgi:hypothetical protein
MLRYFNICDNPEDLTDEQWALQIQLLARIRKEENNTNNLK